MAICVCVVLADQNALTLQAKSVHFGLDEQVANYEECNFLSYVKNSWTRFLMRLVFDVNPSYMEALLGTLLLYNEEVCGHKLR